MNPLSRLSLPQREHPGRAVFPRPSRKSTATGVARVREPLRFGGPCRPAASHCLKGVTGEGWRFGVFAPAASRCASHRLPGRLRRSAPAQTLSRRFVPACAPCPELSGRESARTWARPCQRDSSCT